MIHWVPTADDGRLEPYRHVGDHQWLRQHDLFVAEGRLVVSRLIALDRFTIRSVLVNRAAHDALLPALSSLDTEIYVCDDATLAGITGFNFHRGCLALATRPAPLPLDALPAAALPATAGTRHAPRLLALEGVGNPDNVGGLFRTAAAFGVDGVLLDPTSGDPLYRKAVRTSMGAALKVPWVRSDEWLADLGRLRDRGFIVIALTPHESAIPVADFARDVDPRRPLTLLVGAEGPGLPDLTLARADARVRIPIEPVVDSLNVVVAAGIALERLGR